MPNGGSAITRALRSEWTKVRSVPSTPWLLVATIAVTIGFGVLVCSALGTSGSPPGCVPGNPGCGDEDVILNSLSGVYLGQIPAIALGVLVATSEYATGTIKATFTALPRRTTVVIAKSAVLAAPILAAGLAASAASFLLGQPILHTNGFVPEQGYPLASLTDPVAARAIVGTALYFGVIGIFAFALGTITRRVGSATVLTLAVVYLPAIVSLMLGDPIRSWLQRLSPMTAGLAIQRTVQRADSIPIGTWTGLGVAAAWSAAALVTATQLARHRDV
jgi:ABC-2 type transport system permease protein